MPESVSSGHYLPSVRAEPRLQIVPPILQRRGAVINLLQGGPVDFDDEQFDFEPVPLERQNTVEDEATV